MPFSSSLGSLLTSSSHDPRNPKNMTWQKEWVCLMFGMSLKVKNMQKQENLLRCVETK
jgi:hypothetical protein